MTGPTENTALKDASQEEELPPVSIVLGAAGDEMMRFWLKQDPLVGVHLVPMSRSDRIGYSIKLTKRTNNFRITSKRTIENNNFIAGRIIRSEVQWTSKHIHAEWGSAGMFTDIWDYAVYQTTNFIYQEVIHICTIKNPTAQFDAEGTFECTDYSPTTDTYFPSREVHTWQAKFQWLSHSPTIRDGKWHVYDVEFNGRKLAIDE